jgi:hypothetical protein
MTIPRPRPARAASASEYRAVATRLERLARNASDLAMRRQLEETVRVLRERANALGGGTSHGRSA